MQTQVIKLNRKIFANLILSTSLKYLGMVAGIIHPGLIRIIELVADRAFSAKIINDKKYGKESIRRNECRHHSSRASEHHP